MRTSTVYVPLEKFSKVNKAKAGLVKKSFQGWQDPSVGKGSSTQPGSLNSVPGVVLCTVALTHLHLHTCTAQ